MEEKFVTNPSFQVKAGLICQGWVYICMVAGQHKYVRPKPGSGEKDPRYMEVKSPY